MNFLAHIYLSEDIPLRQIGNFMADAVKGADVDLYEDELKLGILLHRKIDSFTDSHTFFRQSVRRLFNEYRHYSPVIVDMFYDHFLAKYWSQFHSMALDDFIECFYQHLQQEKANLPQKTQRLLPILLEENWLLKYRTIEGLEHILTQMDRRTNNRSLMRNSTQQLREHYQLYEKDFFSFMPEIQQHVKDATDVLTTQLRA